MMNLDMQRKIIISEIEDLLDHIWDIAQSCPEGFPKNLTIEYDVYWIHLIPPKIKGDKMIFRSKYSKTPLELEKIGDQRLLNILDIIKRYFKEIALRKRKTDKRMRKETGSCVTRPFMKSEKERKDISVIMNGFFFVLSMIALALVLIRSWG